MPIDPQTGMGWKSTNNVTHLSNVTTAELKKGLEDLTYNYDEIGQDHNNPVFGRKITLYLLLVLATHPPVSHTPLLANVRDGLVQVLGGSKPGTSQASSQEIILNENLSYFLVFFDPTFAVFSGNPSTVPRTLLTIPSSAGNVLIYLKVFQHITLNTEHSPCLESEHYSYASCINRKVSQTIGCQSFWTNYSGFPVCSDLKQYSRYVDEYDRLVHLEKNKLRVESGCHLPCSYIEYSVGNTK